MYYSLKTTLMAALLIAPAALLSATQAQAGTIVSCGDADTCTSPFTLTFNGSDAGAGQLLYDAKSGDISLDTSDGSFSADMGTVDVTSDGFIMWTMGTGETLTVRGLSGNADPVLGFSVAASTTTSSATFAFNFDLPIAIDGPILAESTLGYSLTTTDGFGKISTVLPTVLNAADLDTDGPGSRIDKGVNIGTDFIVDPAGNIGTGTTSFNASNTFNLPAGYDLMAVTLNFALDDNSNVGITGAVSQTVIPVPAAVWLFGSGLIGLIAVARRKKV